MLNLTVNVPESADRIYSTVPYIVKKMTLRVIYWNFVSNEAKTDVLESVAYQVFTTVERRLFTGREHETSFIVHGEFGCISRFLSSSSALTPVVTMNVLHNLRKLEQSV